MILYHGTTMDIPEPKIITNEIGRDFGFGFYTTDIKEQAERWALRRARIAARRTKRSVEACVNVYEWDENPMLSMKRFEEASMEWLEFVVRCRSDIHYTHSYDIVEGKIANDNVGETVSYVVRGIMRPEDAIEKLRFEKINNQIAFCTALALESLHYKNCYMLEVL